MILEAFILHENLMANVGLVLWNADVFFLALPFNIYDTCLKNSLPGLSNKI